MAGEGADPGEGPGTVGTLQLVGRVSIRVPLLFHQQFISWFRHSFWNLLTKLKDGTKRTTIVFLNSQIVHKNYLNKGNK